MNQGKQSAVAGKRLLVVDDEPTIRESLERVLRLEGYQVTTVASGPQVFRHLHEDPVDLVLLDINLAGESGLEVCERIRTTQPKLAVIGITALPDQTSAAAAAGMNALMEKPLDMPALLVALRKMLR